MQLIRFNSGPLKPNNLENIMPLLKNTRHEAFAQARRRAPMDALRARAEWRKERQDDFKALIAGADPDVDGNS